MNKSISDSLENPYVRAVTETIEAGRRFRLVFLGDSLTSTEWVHPNYREIIEYVLKMTLKPRFDHWKKSSWGIRCYNAGFDGATSADWLDLVDSEVLALSPTMVLVLGTENDPWGGISPEDGAENIARLVTQLRSGGVEHVVYATSFASLYRERDASYRPYVEAVQKRLKISGVPAIDLLKAFAEFDLQRLYTFRLDEDDDLTGEKAGDIDSTHPNTLGNAYVAALLLKEIFGIVFDPERYIVEARTDVKYPSIRSDST